MTVAWRVVVKVSGHQLEASGKCFDILIKETDDAEVGLLLSLFTDMMNWLEAAIFGQKTHQDIGWGYGPPAEPRPGAAHLQCACIVNKQASAACGWVHLQWHGARDDALPLLHLFIRALWGQTSGCSEESWAAVWLQEEKGSAACSLLSPVHPN